MRTPSALLSSAIAIAIVTGCHGSKTTTGSDAASSASASPTAVVAPDRNARVTALLRAEHERDTSKVTGEDLVARDVIVRRQAVRALARIADEAAGKPLTRALADEDEEVSSWAAYGLGYACKGHESATVRALVSRAASLTGEPARKEAPARLKLFPTLADALARCGNAEAEATLRGWLDTEEHAEDAALALGRLASRKKHLDDASIVALLDAASRPEKPLGAALFAFTRLQGLSDAVQARLLDVCSDALGGPAGARRSFAVRALGRAGQKAVPPLAKVLGGDAYTLMERADAARELPKLGEEGQAALRYALGQLAPKVTTKDAMATAEFGVLLSVLESVTLPAKEAKGALEHLADLEVMTDSPTLQRRSVTLRCKAAVLLAGEAMAHPKLLACDPDAKSPIGKLATLKVLDRGRLSGTRLKRWQGFVEDKLPVVRQAAIELLASHPEVAAPQPILAKALRAPDAGTVAAAAQVISAYPDRAAEKRPEREEKKKDSPDEEKGGGLVGSDAEPPAAIKPHPAVVDALTSAFTVQRPPDSVEVWSALMGAAGALQVLSFKPKLDALCKSDNPTLREHAEKALHLLGEQRRVCKPAGPGKAPEELAHPPPEHATLVFDTDAGSFELTLDSAYAPVAVERFIELAKAGFFENTVIHRVVPGFVVQLGDPGGDGYGGAGKEPLRCETSPLPFGPYAVGVALAGRDTGSSQLFVTLGPFPHLDGDYALIGQAKPGWERIAQGDVVRKVSVKN